MSDSYDIAKLLDMLQTLDLSESSTHHDDTTRTSHLEPPMMRNDNGNNCINFQPRNLEALNTKSQKISDHNDCASALTTAHSSPIMPNLKPLDIGDAFKKGPTMNMTNLSTNHVGRTDRLKTKMCHSLVSGNCSFGSKCLFAHSVDELRIVGDDEKASHFKQKTCKWFNVNGVNKCIYGTHCRFAHGTEELKQ